MGYYGYPPVGYPQYPGITWWAGLAGFCQKVEKTVFSMVKTGLAKILFAGKNRFMSELSSK